MSHSTFKGTSENGNIQEALDDAIQLAKSTLHTDFVQWTLKEISGEDGGFVLVRKVFVTINVSTDAGKK